MLNVHADVSACFDSSVRAYVGGTLMKRFIQGEDRTQGILLPELLDDYVADTNPVRVIDVFVDELDLGKLDFEDVTPAATGRPSYHPAILLKIYIYGYLNRIQSSRRLEREAQRNVELMWLTGRLMPRTSKPSPTSARTTAKQFAVSVASLWCCASSSACFRKHSSPSTGASSRQSTTATATSPAQSCSGVWTRSKPVSIAILQHSIRQTDKNLLLQKSGPGGYKTRSRH